MAGPSTNTSCYPPAATSQLERLWASDDGFSEERCNRTRSDTTEQKLRADSDSRLLEHIRLDNERFANSPPDIDITPHPIFDRSNFVTNLPLDEVQEQLKPVLQLAMMYLAHARALEWFAHVRYARRVCKSFYQNWGLCVLQPPSSPITPSMISSVRQEILSLAGCVKLTFMGSSRPGSATQSSALCVYTVPELQVLLSLLLRETPLPPSRKVSDYAFAPCILLMADFFYALLQHRHGKWPHRKLRFLQLDMASTIVHEFAHAWVFYCHPRTSPQWEPLIFPDDLIAEAGVSWENFMFGARIHSTCRPEPMMRLVANDMVTLYREPRTAMCGFVRHVWIDQWFSSEPWAGGNFDRLHRAGTLYAPLASCDVSWFDVPRFCSTRKRGIILPYHRGLLACGPCCDDETCSAREPGNGVRWPEDPDVARQIYLIVLDREKEVAKQLSVDFKWERPAEYAGHVVAAKVLAEIVEKEAKALVLWTDPADLEEQLLSWFFAMLDFYDIR
jgi:hypothetical protein